MTLEASAYATLALASTIAFGLISVAAFALLNALSIKLHEKTKVTRLMRTQVVYSMRSMEAQGLRDKPCPLYRGALAVYSTFCVFVIGLLTTSYFIHEECLNILPVLFVTVCLGYTGWVVFRVSTVSRNFISALQNENDSG